MLKSLGTLIIMGLLFASNTLQAEFYDETYRPQFHYSPPSGWMNDPNGLVFVDGTYHMFYQYYPEKTVWGPMHWGHVESTDLVNWKQNPIALAPDKLGYIFSGSAIVDKNNDSGLGTMENPALLAFFTYHNPEISKLKTRNHEYQGLAYSLDNGKSFIKYKHNPILPNPGNLQDFRDPKVFWHKESNRWIMVLSVSDHVQFWHSNNLLDWTYASSFGKEIGAHGGVWECPDLIQFTVEGTNETKWALLLNLNPGGPQGGSGFQYFVGDFDGTSFVLDESFAKNLEKETAIWLDTGRDNYASVSWSNIPEHDGRAIIIGWMSNWDYAQTVPTSPWRSAMTLPRSLTLHKTEVGYRLFASPVNELIQLRQTEKKLTLNETKTSLPSSFELMQSEFLLSYDLTTSPNKAGFIMSNDVGERYAFYFDKTANLFISDRTATTKNEFNDKFSSLHKAQRVSSNDTLKLQVFVDAHSIEIFVDNGANNFTETFFPTQKFNNIEWLEQKSITDLSLFPLKSIWRSN